MLWSTAATLACVCDAPFRPTPLAPVDGLWPSRMWFLNEPKPSGFRVAD